MKMLPSLSIFFPSLNDSKVLSVLLRDAYRVGRGITDNLEIIVIDDGSTDATPEVLARLKKSIPVLRTVRHRSNLGYGAALHSGCSAATKEFVFYTDGDGQYDVTDLTRLVGRMREDIDVVNGIKQKRDDRWDRILLGTIYARTMRRLFHLPVEDVDCDFRLMRARVLGNIHLKSTGGAICVELVKRLEKAGARFAQVSVHHHKRQFGHSQFYTMQNITKLIRELWVLWREFFVP